MSKVVSENGSNLLLVEFLQGSIVEFSQHIARRFEGSYPPQMLP
jgi:hypothetical protein